MVTIPSLPMSGAQLKNTLDALNDEIGAIPKPESFGASGNGIDNDTAAFDAALASSPMVTLTPGRTYRIANIRLNPGNTLYIPHSSALMAHSSLANNEPMIKTSAQVDNPNVAILGTGLISGAGIGVTGASRTRVTPLIRISRASNFRMEGVRVDNTGYIGLTLRNVQGSLISGCTFTRIGYSGQDDNAGSAIWVGTGPEEPFSYNCKIIGNHFEDLEWSAIDMVGAFNYVIVANTIDGCYEAGIFMSERDDQDDTHSRAASVIGNSIQNVRLKEVSAQGIESNVRNGVIAGNSISFTDKGGIALLDAKNVSVTSNIIGDVNQGDHDRAAIDFFSSVERGVCENIIVSDNVVWDRAATPTTAYALAFFGIGGQTTAQSRNIRAINNMFNTPFTVADFYTPLVAYDTATCVIRDNHGAPDLTPRRLMNTTAAGLSSITGYEGRTVFLTDEDKMAVYAGGSWRRLALEP